MSRVYAEKDRKIDTPLMDKQDDLFLPTDSSLPLSNNNTHYTRSDWDVLDMWLAL